MLFSTAILRKMERGCPLFTSELGLADKLDALQQGKIESGINQLIAFTYRVTTGSADIKIFNAAAPFKFEIVDVIIQPRGDSTSGTIKLTNGTNNITNTIACAADKTIGRATTIDDLYSEIAKNGTLQIVCAGNTIADTIALVTVLAIAKD